MNAREQDNSESRPKFADSKIHLPFSVLEPVDEVRDGLSAIGSAPSNVYFGTRCRIRRLRRKN